MTQIKRTQACALTPGLGPATQEQTHPDLYGDDRPLRPTQTGLCSGGPKSEKNKGGWKTQGRGKHTVKPLPKNGFGPPPTYDTFPHPVCFHPVVFLRGNQHRPGKSNFLRPPKLVLEGALYGTFPGGPERHLDAARQKLPRDNFCRSAAAQLPSPRGQFGNRKKSPLLWGRGTLGGILRDNLGEGN